MYIKLKQHLIELGITHKKLADLMGLSQSSFSKKINAKGSDFNLREVSLICNKLKIDPNVYFFRPLSCFDDNEKSKNQGCE